MELETLKTPCLLLDVERVRRNAERMSERVRRSGANLRPHVKTHKCIEVARLQTSGHSGAITVSTLREARAFLRHGFKDILYAVPIEPGKFAEAVEIRRECENFSLITDDPEIPEQLDNHARRAGVRFDIFLKIDCGYHRCGVEPESAWAVEIPRRALSSSNLRFKGILTHAGHSYHSTAKEQLERIARHERDLMIDMASRLRSQDIPVEVISIGSTPTITHVDHLEGVTEARPGNYIFFDAFQATLGSCGFEDCALTVLAAVVHLDRTRRRVVVDAGAIALSKDRGAVELDPACGYGRVLDLEGLDTGARLEGLSQEHGEVSVPYEESFSRFKVGTRVRILANHSCLTAAQHSHYNVLERGHLVDHWEIQRGW
ncbi:MAG: alanine racemase [Acidobacteria bacterium]|nr:alanine racemase [Acidobacteriota bacterium]